MWTEIINVDNEEYFKDMTIIVTEVVKGKLDKFKDIAKVLADEVDYANRTALSIASEDVKKVFYKCLFFMERYEFHTGPPVYKSLTSLIILATDHLVVDKIFIPKFKKYEESSTFPGYLTKDLFDKCFNDWKKTFAEEALTCKSLLCEKTQSIFNFNDCDLDKCGKVNEKEFVTYCSKVFERRVVILKFMKYEDQYRKEVNVRSENHLSADYVVNIISSDEENEEKNDENIVTAIKAFNYKNLNDYKFMIVLTAAGRSLKDVIEKEDPDDNLKKSLLRGVAEAVQYIHGKGLIHGDIKALNIVLSNENKIKLIDFDASLKKGIDYAGAKFSSGILPPEMFVIFNKAGRADFEKYFNGVEAEHWMKAEPVKKDNNCYYSVRAFNTKGDIMNIARKGTEALDIWSFGLLMYYMLNNGNTSFIQVDKNNDLGKTATDFGKIIDMTDNIVINNLRQNIKDPLALNLLIKILKVEPSERLSFEDILVCDCLSFIIIRCL